MNRTITIKGIGKLSLKPDQTMDPPCMARAGAAPTAMDIEPDDIGVSDSVTFVWEIR